MANSLQDFGQKIQDLAARSLQDQLRSAQRCNEWVQRFGRGELFKKSVRDDYLRFLNDETADYARNVTSLSVNYFKELIDLNRTYNDSFFEQVLGAPPTDNAAESPAPRQNRSAEVLYRHVEIELRGIVGMEATRTFIIESKRAEVAEISFLVSDFVGADSTAPFRPQLEFQPARFTLNPGEERVVTLRLQLDSEKFVSGQRYTATALAHGYDDLELGLVVLPEKAETPAKPKESAPKLASSRRKSKRKRKP